MKRTKNAIWAALIIYVFFAAYWALVAVNGQQGATSGGNRWSALYGIMALYGGLVGLKVSRTWGGLKSLIGKATFFVALGLLAQEFGQIVYSMYYYLFQVNIPYPSFGDIGYFGSVICYIVGAYYLIKALKTKSALGSRLRQFWIALIPIALLGTSYYMFLKGYSFDFHHPLTIFLDFGYPLGQAFYISLALIVFVLSRRYLGGVMKPVILFLIFAFVMQYLSDFTFLYQTSRNTWKTAGFNELMYLTSYFVMTLGLIYFWRVVEKMRLGGGDDS